MLFTDGIIERRAGGEMFGDTHLEASLRALAGSTASELARQVEDAAVTYAATAPDDDMAVVAVRVTPPRRSTPE